MNPMLLSQHQVTDIAAYLDTLIVPVHDSAPLDIALPLVASQLISQELTIRIQDRFRGRAGFIAGAPSHTISPLVPDHLRRLLYDLPYEVRFGLVLTDRVLLDDFRYVTTEATEWVVFDWWQWLRHRLPKARSSDALMYLCVASLVYEQSEVFQQIGFSADVRAAMIEEGNKLYGSLETAVSEVLLAAWSQSVETS